MFKEILSGSHVFIFSSSLAEGGFFFLFSGSKALFFFVGPGTWLLMIKRYFSFFISFYIGKKELKID